MQRVIVLSVLLLSITCMCLAYSSTVAPLYFYGTTFKDGAPYPSVFVQMNLNDGTLKQTSFPTAGFRYMPQAWGSNVFHQNGLLYTGYRLPISSTSVSTYLAVIDPNTGKLKSKGIMLCSACYFNDFDLDQSTGDIHFLSQTSHNSNADWVKYNVLSNKLTTLRKGVAPAGAESIAWNTATSTLYASYTSKLYQINTVSTNVTRAAPPLSTFSSLAYDNSTGTIIMFQRNQNSTPYGQITRLTAGPFNDTVSSFPVLCSFDFSRNRGYSMVADSRHGAVDSSSNTYVLGTNQFANSNYRNVAVVAWWNLSTCNQNFKTFPALQSDISQFAFGN